MECARNVSPKAAQDLCSLREGVESCTLLARRRVQRGVGRLVPCPCSVGHGVGEGHQCFAALTRSNGVQERLLRSCVIGFSDFEIGRELHPRRLAGVPGARQFRTVLKMTGRIVRVDNLVTEAVDRLRSASVKLKRGLSNRELAGIERSLGFTFNPEHRRLLALVLPTGESWPDWRHASTDQLRLRFDWPIDGVIFDVQNNGFWPSSWGERPGDPSLAERCARDQLSRVPRLVPIYGHRYMAADSAYAPSPVFSVYQTDVIYYGDNLLDYISHEFRIPPLHPSDPTRVPFWSDLALGTEAKDL